MENLNKTQKIISIGVESLLLATFVYNFIDCLCLNLTLLFNGLPMNKELTFITAFSLFTFWLYKLIQEDIFRRSI